MLHGTRLLWLTCTALAGLGLLGLLWICVGRAGWQVEPAFAGHLPEIDAEIFFVEAPQIVRAGPSRLAVVRIAGPAQLVPHTFASAGLEGPVPIGRWAQALGAPVVFNAGQFDPNFNHLGWLKARGQWLSRSRKLAWMGLLVSGPQQAAAPGGMAAALAPWAQVVDLAREDAAVAERYDHVLQSMMLVDDAAQVRVRRSTTAACRTVVAQDVRGRMLVLVSEGAVTLDALARWLPQSGLQIVRAMNLDGGAESQLAIVTPQLELLLYGQYGSDSRGLRLPQAGTGHAPLPAVVAVTAPARSGGMPSPPPAP